MGVIVRVAGTGSLGGGGDDGAATSAVLSSPYGLAVTSDGGFLIADIGIGTVRRVSAAGVITRIAGTGITGRAGDDGPAVSATLVAPFGVAGTPDGGFLVADLGGHTVRRVSPAGVITRVAGTGAPGGGGDDGHATAAQLSSPIAVAAAADGSFVVADITEHTVRRVSTDGVITRVAGTGAPGTGGDGGPATVAPLASPRSVAVTADGALLIAEPGAAIVRKVAADGVISRVAGQTGVFGSSGDGGPATDATLANPTGVAVTPDGGFLITDTATLTVRHVGADGVITRVAGTTGVVGATGDDGLATAATFSNPIAVAALGDGGFLVADSTTVRRVDV